MRGERKKEASVKSVAEESRRLSKRPRSRSPRTRSRESLHGPRRGGSRSNRYVDRSRSPVANRRKIIRYESPVAEERPSIAQRLRYVAEVPFADTHRKRRLSLKDRLGPRVATADHHHHTVRPSIAQRLGNVAERKTVKDRLGSRVIGHPAGTTGWRRVPRSSSEVDADAHLKPKLPVKDRLGPRVTRHPAEASKAMFLTQSEANEAKRKVREQQEKERLDAELELMFQERRAHQEAELGIAPGGSSTMTEIHNTAFSDNNNNAK